MKRFALIVACAIVSPFAWQAPALAQSDFQAQLIGYHTLCDHGDRKACIRFGMLIEHHKDMQAEWRHSHPEWFWWEK
jgi:hypothetical protein